MPRITVSVALLAALAPEGASAGTSTARLFEPSAIVIASPLAPDTVTAYSTTMSRYRLALSGRRGDADLSAALGPTAMLDQFRAWTWRSPDGSLLQGFSGNGGFRMTVGDCLMRMCSAAECSDDGWPAVTCSDGRRRRVMVTGFAVATFDGVAYRRLNAPPLVSDKLAAPGE